MRTSRIGLPILALVIVLASAVLCGAVLRDLGYVQRVPPVMLPELHAELVGPDGPVAFCSVLVQSYRSDSRVRSEPAGLDGIARWVEEGTPRFALAGRYDVLFESGRRKIVCSMDVLPGVFNQIMVDWELSDAWINYHPLQDQWALHPSWESPDTLLMWPDPGSPPIGSPPVCKERTPPEYPPLARHRYLEGVVFLELGIDKSADILTLRVLQGIPGLNEAARDCVRQWRFRAALYRGERLRARIDVPVRFTLH
jgi:TonB family protein